MNYANSIWDVYYFDGAGFGMGCNSDMCMIMYEVEGLCNEFHEICYVCIFVGDLVLDGEERGYLVGG